MGIRKGNKQAAASAVVAVLPGTYEIIGWAHGPRRNHEPKITFSNLYIEIKIQLHHYVFLQQILQKKSHLRFLRGTFIPTI